MADLINFSNGIRGARIDPLLCGNQSKKLVPEARARRNSFSSKENSNVAAQEESSSSTASVVGRKHLSNEFEKTHCNGVNQTTETRRKSNPDGYMKQTTQERVSLGKKKTNSVETSAGVTAAMDESHKQQPATFTPSMVLPSKIDHFQKSSIVPEQGASPKKGGLRFMAGPPEFVADAYIPKKLHTHTVGDARAKNCTVGGLMKQQQQENFSVASSSVSSSVVRPRANNSSATYNIITGQ